MDKESFILDEYYEQPHYGRLKFVGFYMDYTGYFRNEDGNLLVLSYISFPPPEPKTWFVRIGVEHVDGRFIIGGLYEIKSDIHYDDISKGIAKLIKSWNE